MKLYLGQFQEWVKKKNKNIPEVTPGIIEDYRVFLVHTYKKRNGGKLKMLTVLSMLNVLNVYFKYLVKEKCIFLDPTRELVFPKRKDYLPKRILSESEIEILLNQPDDSPLGIRNKSILELFYSTGIRRQELCNLNVSDVNLRDQILHLRETKTRHDRLVPFGQKAKEALERYLTEARYPLIHVQVEEAFFLSQGGRRIFSHNINTMMKKYAKRMGLEGCLGPHCLRHSCATHMLVNGAGIKEVQMILGHKKIRSTQRYTHLNPKDLRTVVNRCHPRERMSKKKQTSRGEGGDLSAYKEDTRKFQNLVLFNRLTKMKDKFEIKPYIRKT